ncbi:MAG: 50S ribosomal protein L10 [Pyrodictiaceae archaeon]
MSLVARRRIPEWKIKVVEELVDLITKNPVILIVDLANVRTAQLQKLKKKIEKRLGGKVMLKVAKNSLFAIALRKAGGDPSKLKDYLTGTNLFIFTSENPFTIASEISRIYVTAPAKPGDITETEIVIPAGDTGLKPGPIMSVFGKLKIPTRVQKGTIWIARDTKVAKPGDTISPELASVLQKLGIEPIVVRLKVKAAYDHGLVIPGDQLVLNLSEYQDMVNTAVKNALWIGVEIAYPEPRVLELAIPLAVRRALAVAAEAGYVVPETAEYVIRIAVAKAYALIAALGDRAKELGLEVRVTTQPAPQPSREEKRREKEEEEEKEREEAVSEEQLAAGLESLFGS